jgi:hypothetical protein
VKWRTTSRPNGERTNEVREQVIGLQAILGWAAIIVTIVGAVIYDRIQLESRLNQTAADVLSDRRALINTIKVAIEESDRENGFVTRLEWNAKLEELAKEEERRDARIERRLDRIESHGQHTLSVVEKLPVQKDN